MITFIFGGHGSGKTEEIFRRLRADAASGASAILLVPEQSTVAAERRAAAELPPQAQLHIEVLNFSRLCERVFRTVGGLSCRHATEGVRRVTMLRALRSVAPLLGEYRDAAAEDAQFVRRMLTVQNEFSACGIQPEDIDRAVGKLRGSRAEGKLRDIGTVLAAYRALLSRNFEEPADDLYRLSRLPDPATVFGGLCVYMDGFSGLTGVEHRIAAMLMRYARNFCVTLPLCCPRDRGADTESLSRMSDRLRADAAATGLPNETVTLSDLPRYRSASVKKLSADLWNPSAEPEQATDGSVRILRAADAYDEAESCAAEIRRLVAEGFRYRDIAVIARRAESRRGILDRAFEDAGIRWFLSERVPLSSAAPARLMLSALRICTGGWQREDVIAHIKTGLCGITSEEADLFEIYTERWKITGKRFLGDDWAMNPDGYTDRLNERSARILETVNEVRGLLRDRLGPLSEALRSARSCRDCCAALYRYGETLCIRERMQERAEAEARTGRIREAQDAARVWDAVVTALEEVSDAYGDAPAPGAAEFTQALEAVLDASSMGSIPVSGDAVTVGSAHLLRTDSPRCTVLLGLSDGEFPAVPEETGLISAEERRLIAGVLPLQRDSESDASDELYYVRRAMASASERLLLYVRQDGSSVAAAAVRRLLPGVPEAASDTDLTDRILSPETAAEYASLLHGTPEAEALAALTRELGIPTPALDASNPVRSDRLSVRPEDAAAAAGKTAVLTQSRLECFLSCPFRYYCRYTLGLDSGGSAEFSRASVGTFTHAILEAYLREIYTVRHGVFPDEEERSALLDRVVAGCLERLAPENSGQRTARIEHLSRRLHFLAEIITEDIIRELKDSDFVPVAFELSIGRDGIPPLRFPLRDGSFVSLEGTVDRVDLFRRGDTAYLRTVDYKTGSKTFSLRDIENGENLQLLLYLFSLTRNPGAARDLTGGAAPAEGAFTYLSAGAPRTDRNPSDTEGIRSAVAEGLSRSGGLSSAEGVAYAVSHAGDPKMLMGDENKRITLSADGFEELFLQVRQHLTDRAEEIRSGQAAARPAEGAATCKNCEYAEICRSAQKE